jgi:hypothetical protein
MTASASAPAATHVVRTGRPPVDVSDRRGKIEGQSPWSKFVVRIMRRSDILSIELMCAESTRLLKVRVAKTNGSLWPMTRNPRRSVSGLPLL